MTEIPGQLALPFDDPAANVEYVAPEPRPPCWELKPKFCASLTNGHGRCRKGTCLIAQIRRWPLELGDAPGRHIAT